MNKFSALIREEVGKVVQSIDPAYAENDSMFRHQPYLNAGNSSDVLQIDRCTLPCLFDASPGSISNFNATFVVLYVDGEWRYRCVLTGPGAAISQGSALENCGTHQATPADALREEVGRWKRGLLAMNPTPSKSNVSDWSGTTLREIDRRMQEVASGGLWRSSRDIPLDATISDVRRMGRGDVRLEYCVVANDDLFVIECMPAINDAPSLSFHACRRVWLGKDSNYTIRGGMNGMCPFAKITDHMDRFRTSYILGITILDALAN